MRIFRILTAIVIAVLLAPLVPLLTAAGVALASCCPIGWETAARCVVFGHDLGGLIDILFRLGVPGLLSGRLAMLVFALWTLLELAGLCLRHASDSKRRPVSLSKHQSENDAGDEAANMRHVSNAAGVHGLVGANNGADA